ncbi:MAG: glycosyltransferase [Candidatus Bathyarchaeia archaeon]
MVEKLVDSPLVSFVLPAFNEGEVIERALERLDSVVNGDGLHYEVVVVDDGSVDDTRLKALRYAGKNSHVFVVGYDSNAGKGFAVRTGFFKCKGEYVVFIDSDLDVDVDVVQRYVEALKDVHIAIGSKWHPDSVVNATFARKFSSRVFNALVRLLIGLQICDTQCGVKAVRREVFLEIFRRLSVKRYAFDVELLVLAKLFGLRVVELPVRLKLNSNFSLKNAWHMLLDLLGIAYRLRVKKWYQRGIAKDFGF